MAYPFNRALIACSVSALALAIVTLYYWQVRKTKRKLPSNNSNCFNEATTEVESLSEIELTLDATEQIFENQLKRSNQVESNASFRFDVDIAESALLTSFCSEKEVSLKSVPTVKGNCNDLSVKTIQSTIIADSEGDIRKIIKEVPEALSFQQTNLLSISSNQNTTNFSTKTTSENEFANSITIQNLQETIESADCNDSPLKIDSLPRTMQLKSSNNLSSPTFSESSSTCAGAVDLVKKVKHHLPSSVEAPSSASSEHLKLSSIAEFDNNNSKSANSILTIEMLGQREAHKAEVSYAQASSALATNGKNDEHCKPRLLQDADVVTTTTATDANSNFPTDSSSIMNSDNSKESTCNHKLSNADNGESSASATNDKQSRANTSNSAKTTQPTNGKRAVTFISKSVKPGQTFAQVLSSSRNNTNKSNQDDKESNKQTMQDTEDSQESNITSQVKEDVEDAYHNYPDATLSSEGQCSPNSDFSDASNDSGKGGSDIHHVNYSNSVDQTLSDSYHIVNTESDDQFICYQFEMPYLLCGKLIGTNGHHINTVKQKTNTQIVVNSNFYNSNSKICSITGNKSNVLTALNFIRRRFPIKDYPDVTLIQLNIPFIPTNPVPTIPLTQSCQLHLLPDIMTEVIISCSIDAGHFFLQQPTHPSYTQLNHLDFCMKAHYSQTDAPQMPHVQSGVICAAPTAEGWYRALIQNVHQSNLECDIMFVDYGGYAYNVPVSTLRQIRYDFMSLPFQASECYLANVLPVDNESTWSQEANDLFDKFAHGQIVYSLIHGYAENGIPFVNLFKNEDNKKIFFNKELVYNGHAIWLDNSFSSTK